MDNKAVIGIVGVVVGLGAGYFLFAAPEINMEEPAKEMETMDAAMQHSHAMLEIDTTEPIPSVSVTAIRDSKDGYNLSIATTNYTWSPEQVGGAPIQGEGHAHVYVNGTKVARVYGEWFHLGGDHLQNGENVIEITLNANDHSEWIVNGQHISDTITLTK